MSQPYSKILRELQSHLTDDLLKPQFRGTDIPFYGHCYVAAEALFHLLGGRESGWKPTRAKDTDGITHWWLEKGGVRLDPTVLQYHSRGLDPPYDQGRRTAFLTVAPSKRARVLLERLDRIRSHG